ncbi:hypothetical protein Pse7367_1949 [Thalassoporum mexicanum PCC 7367]|uniref:hypothetical protein n=1 Tax=Thalassoporum mexicanum TaxID=3457544 RepID=UPI00029FCEC0|nr:hypothetical protein [Pseudanabaena sp. PCC 7367]AFY70224.1 hypothetical protein Pse7367_1949 [Pseudanabaena sp. PCC 7367]
MSKLNRLILIAAVGYLPIPYIFNRVPGTTGTRRISISSKAIAATQSVGSVSCSSIDGSIQRHDEIILATIAKSRQGYEIYLREPTMQHRLILDPNRVITQASSSFDLDRQGNYSQWTDWNLIAYDRTPIKIGLDGRFVIEMMVSSRSVCSFEGIANLVNSESAGSVN